MFLLFFHLHTRFRQPSSYYVNSLYSYCPLFMLTPNCNPFQFICLRHPLLIEDVRIPAIDVYNAQKRYAEDLSLSVSVGFYFVISAIAF